MKLTFVVTFGRLLVSVMSAVKVMVSPLPALLMALRKSPSLPTLKFAARTGLERIIMPMPRTVDSAVALSSRTVNRGVVIGGVATGGIVCILRRARAA
ncbi:hypothetical protein MKI84_06875 [Ancylobacter sp. A5.8]|nr:hypothetical protein [Ancylobacter gelatini]